MSKKQREKTSVNKKRWSSYAAAAGAVAALAAPQAADADITHVVVGQTLDAATATNFFTATALGGGSASIVLGHLAIGAAGTAGFAGFYAGNAGPGTAMFGGFASGFKYVSNLSTNAVVSAGPFSTNDAGFFATMAYGVGFTNSQFLAPGVGFVGFKFDNGGGIQYGWVRVDMTGNPYNSFTVVDYAYGMVGDQITAGQIPEPGSLGLLAAGAAGLAFLRRRRNAA